MLKRNLFNLLTVLLFLTNTNLYSLGTYTTMMYLDGNSANGGELSFLWNNLSGGDWGQGDTANVQNSGYTGTGITGVLDFVPVGNGEIITFHADNTIRKYNSTGFNQWEEVSNLSTGLADPANVNQTSRFLVASDGNDTVYFWGDNRQIQTYTISSNTVTDLTSTNTMVNWGASSLEYHNGNLYSTLDASTANIITINTSTGEFESPRISAKDVNHLYSDPVSGNLLAFTSIADTGTSLVYNVDSAGGTNRAVTGSMSGFFTHQNTTYATYLDGSIRAIDAAGTNDVDPALYDFGTFSDFWKVKGDVQINVPEPISVSYVMLALISLIYRRKRLSYVC